MDKTLKQRLIGASILIALAVIFVPMLFDPVGDSVGSRELEIELPAVPEERTPLRRLPLDPDRTRSVNSERDYFDSEVRGQALDSEPEAVAEYDPVNEPMGTDQADDEQVPSPPSAGPDVPALAERPADNEAVDSWVESDAADLDRAIPPPVDSAAAEPSGWMVQVASFASQANAHELVEQLDGLGHPTRLDTVVRDESTLHRVRTGPYPSRASAHTAVGQIAATVTGVSPVIVDGPVLAQTAVDTAPGFAVQVGSFASRDNAIRLLARLDEAGYTAFVHEDWAGSRTIWRVRVGPAVTRSASEAMLEELTERLGLDGIVVSHP